MELHTQSLPTELLLNPDDHYCDKQEAAITRVKTIKLKTNNDSHLLIDCKNTYKIY